MLCDGILTGKLNPTLLLPIMQGKTISIIVGKWDGFLSISTAIIFDNPSQNQQFWVFLQHKQFHTLKNGRCQSIAAIESG